MIFIKKVGLIEKVKIIGAGECEAEAMFDTGASNNSIDYKIAAKAGVGPIISSVKVKNAFNPKRRPVSELLIGVGDVKFKTKANLEDRAKRPHKILIGRSLMHGNFLIDVANDDKKKDVIGLTEIVTINDKKIEAKFDTGAEYTAIDIKLAKELGVRITGSRNVGNASGVQKRDTGLIEVELNDKKIKTNANISDRSGLNHAVLIGRDVIKGNFIIDVSKNHHGPGENEVK